MSTLTELFTSIADSIRAKDGTSEPINAEDFPDRISAIPSGGGNLNIFVQDTAPSTYNGIWIKSNTFTYENIVETNSSTDLTASSINILSGDFYKTTILDSSNNFSGLDLQFKYIYLTDSNNDVINNVEIYYGTGSVWKQILEYKELNYMYNEGNQFISLDYLPKTLHTKYEIGFMRLEVTGNFKPIINCEEDIRFGIVCSMSGFSQEKGGCWAGTSSTYANTTFSMSTNVKYDIVFDKTGIVLNNTSYNFTDSVPDATASWSTCLNHRRKSATQYSDEFSKARWYYLKIYEDDVLIRDYVPVKKLDNTVCLYEKLAGQYYYNNGSGSFKAGPYKTE